MLRVVVTTCDEQGEEKEGVVSHDGGKDVDAQGIREGHRGAGLVPEEPSGAGGQVKGGAAGVCVSLARTWGTRVVIFLHLMVHEGTQGPSTAAQGMSRG